MEEDKRENLDEFYDELKKEFAENFEELEYMRGDLTIVTRAKYYQLFGMIELDIAKTKLKYYTEKRRLEYILAAKIQREPIDFEKVNRLIEEELVEYYKNIAEIVAKNRNSRYVMDNLQYKKSEFTSLYKLLVKKLHPDVNSGAEKEKLWNQLQRAYKMDNYKAMQEIYSRIELEEDSEKATEEKIVKLFHKIRAQFQEKAYLSNSFPLSCLQLLSTQELIDEKLKILEDEKNIYEMKIAFILEQCSEIERDGQMVS